jgi:hypothetical protein
MRVVRIERETYRYSYDTKKFEASRRGYARQIFVEDSTGYSAKAVFTNDFVHGVTDDDQQSRDT